MYADAICLDGVFDGVWMSFRKNKNIFQKPIDNRLNMWYTIKVITSCSGGIAQLARAIGSYPIGRGFKSNFRYQHKADADNVESVL